MLAGTLTVNGALATSSPVAVHSGALLSGDGMVGTISVYAGASLTAGNDGSGDLNAASVQLYPGCTLDFTLGTEFWARTVS